MASFSKRWLRPEVRLAPRRPPPSRSSSIAPSSIARVGRARRRTREREGRDRDLDHDRSFADPRRVLADAGVPDLRRDRRCGESVRILLRATVVDEPGIHRGEVQARGGPERGRRVGQRGHELARTPRPTRASIDVRWEPASCANFHGHERHVRRWATLRRRDGETRETRETEDAPADVSSRPRRRRSRSDRTRS